MKNKNVRYIAKIAGVSPATVSRYFNGYEYISNKTKRKIEMALRQINDEETDDVASGKIVGICYLAWKDSIDFYSELLDDLLFIFKDNDINVKLFDLCGRTYHNFPFLCCRLFWLFVVQLKSYRSS